MDEEPRCVPWKVLATIVPFARQYIAKLENPAEHGIVWAIGDPFPARVYAGNCRVCWWLHEVHAWLKRRPRPHYHTPPE
jgi:predicted DNA-binding transcriptional regulator AlpA